MNKIEHIDEYFALFGGIKNRRQASYSVSALVNHYFQDSLIFSIIETVDLSNSKLFGEGEIYIYTYHDEATITEIKKKYSEIIEEVTDNKTPIAAYKNWYELNSFIYIGENHSPEIITSDKSFWKFYSKDEGKSEKKDFGYLDDSAFTEKFVEEYSKEYISEYIDKLKSEFDFDKYPHYAIIIRPVSVKHKDRTYKLGNFYLHFATTEKKDIEFYKSFINDFLLVWFKEKGGLIVDTIQVEANQAANKKVINLLKPYYPSIWTDDCLLPFNARLEKKIKKPFGNSESPLKDFFEIIYEESEYNIKIKQSIDVINKELIPWFLNYFKWAKDGTKINLSIKEILKKLNPRAQHNSIKRLDNEGINEFSRILVGRLIINVCSCLFGLSMQEIHSLLIDNSLSYYSNFNSKSDASLIKKRIGPYLSQYFVYSPLGKNILNISNNEVFNSTSKVERDFLYQCLVSIKDVILSDCFNQFNSKSCEKLKLQHDSTSQKRNKISRFAIHDFKNHWCNENAIISKILTDKCNKYFLPPILDCGTGLGDIALSSFCDKEAVLIDTNPINKTEIEVSPYHKYIQSCFFQYKPEFEGDIKTLLISHTLQFIDDDISHLNKKIKEFNPVYIIVVLNTNDEIMGEILNWTYDHFVHHKDCNPEVKIENFPAGYELIDSFPFTAHVKCDNFSILTEQISYLMLFELDGKADKLSQFLQSKLSSPEFPINQRVEVYRFSE